MDGDTITKLTNCRLLRGGDLVWDDLWISSATGKILRSQAAFYDGLTLPGRTIDLGGRIVSPGFIDSQLNGAFGFNFSTVLGDMSRYDEKVRDLNRKLVRTGVTSYVPTVTSQTGELYQQVLPHLCPSAPNRAASSGAESLGAHIEGPFINPLRNGVHNVAVLRRAAAFKDLEAVYGPSNLNPSANSPAPVRMITLAPELTPETVQALIPALRERGIIVSIGHSNATYEEASAAVAAGATMITHLFNAMAPLHHRNPGIFGVLGLAERLPRPYFGIIADGIHLHPTTVKIAWNAHPNGFILVTDAMHMAGLPDGRYPWRNGEEDDWIVKKGAVLVLEGRETIAGSSTILIQCVNNFLAWSGAGIPNALRAVTSTPAAMLGLTGIKGSLEAGADADLVVLADDHCGTDGAPQLDVEEVWKFGERVFSAPTGDRATA